MGPARGPDARARRRRHPNPPFARKLSSAATPPPSLAAQTPDPDSYRRTQRRRALIGWGSALVVVALIVLGVVLGSGDGSGDAQAEHERIARIPYGETMTAAQFEAIEAGEAEADVLEGLHATGRPEVRTLPYVLGLFPPPSEGEFCTYWEFSDKPEIFARLCFDHANGELTSKLDGNVHGASRGQGTVI